MSTFIQLVNDVARESGTMGGQTLGTIAGASGRWAKLVNWTSQAWEIIQRDRSDWLFMRKTFATPLVIGQARYSAADLEIDDFGGWYAPDDSRARFSIYDPAIGRRDESRIERMEYPAWEEAFDFGEVQQMRPSLYAIDYDRQFCIGHPPDKAYTLRGSYRRAVQRLVADADEPFIAPDYHVAIVWRALMLLGDDDESMPEVAASFNSYAGVRYAMLSEYTDGVSL